jgi:hypothetical protein
MLIKKSRGLSGDDVSHRICEDIRDGSMGAERGHGDASPTSREQGVAH